MFKKIIGKVCKNPDCVQKDKVREDYVVMCDCGQALEDVTATDKTKVAISGACAVIILAIGAYFGLMRIRSAAKETMASAVSTAAKEGGRAITEAIDKTQGQKVGASSSSPAAASPDPKAAITLVSDGLNLVKENNLQGAIEKFREGTQKDPKNDQAWGNLGAAYIALGKHDAAMEPSRTASSLNSRNPLWHLNLAEIYSIKNDKKNALDEIELAFRNGFNERDNLKNFNFKNIENDKRFIELVRKK
jgi:tetratricopeptide (TPR) repeat protein